MRTFSQEAVRSAAEERGWSSWARADHGQYIINSSPNYGGYRWYITKLALEVPVSFRPGKLRVWRISAEPLRRKGGREQWIATSEVEMKVYARKGYKTQVIGPYYLIRANDRQKEEAQAAKYL